MRSRNIPFLLIIIGLILMIVGIILGESQTGIFIIFPYVVTSNPITILGFIIIMIGFITLFFISLPTSDNFHPDENSKEKKEYGGIILIGPFPIVISSSKRLAVIMLITGLLIFVIITLAVIYLLFLF